MFARRTIVVVLVLYWIAIFTGTHVPSAPSPDFELNDKFMHFSAYCGLTFLLSWCLLRFRPTREGAVVVFLVIAIYGMADEFSQKLVPTRSADVADWLADMIGAGVGFIVYFISMRLVLGRLPVSYSASRLVHHDAA